MISKYIGDKPFWKVLLRLALPIAFQNLLISSLALVDTLMVGQLGDIPLAAVGMAAQWSWLMSLVLFGVGSATALFISQYWGTQDIKGIRRAYGIAMLSTVAVALIFTVTALFAPEFIMKIFNRTPEVVAEGAAYLRFAALSYLATALTSTMSIVLRSTEKVKLPMFISILTTVVNVILNYGLIFGKFGLPTMGAAGAAAATAISAWTGLILTFVISAIQKNILWSPLKDVFAFNKKHLISFYKKATPVILNESMWGLGTVMYNIIFSNLGHEYYAAVTILRTFENIAFVFFVGLCNACSVMIGKSVGSGKIQRAVEDSRRFAILVPLAGTLIGTFCVIFRHPLVSVFNLNGNVTELTVNMAATITLIYGLWITMRNVPYVQIVGIFRPSGDTVTGMKYDLVCLWCIALPITFISAYVLKLPFPLVYFLMYFFEDTPKTVFCLIHYFKMTWIRPVTAEGKAGLEDFRANRIKKKG